MVGEGINSIVVPAVHRSDLEADPKFVVTNPMHVIEFPRSRQQQYRSWSWPRCKGCNVTRCLNQEQRQKILQIWQIFVVLTVIISSCCISFMWSRPTPSFTVSLTSLWSLIAYAGDAVYITDMAVKFCTGSYKNHRLLAIVDLLTIITFELLALTPSLRLMSGALLRSNRIGRLHVVLDYFNTLQSWFSFNATRVLACKLLTIASIYLHIMACTWCAVTDFGQLEDISIDDNLGQYVQALTTTVTGYGNVVPATIELEKWFAVVSMVIGVVVFYGVILSGMSSHMMNMDMERASYVHHMNVTKRRLRKSQTPPKTAEDVIKYHEYVLCYRNEDAYQTLMSKLPMTFQADIAHSAYEHILKDTFPYRSIGFMRMLSLELKRMFFVPGQTILHQNDMVDTMRYLTDGVLEAEDMEDDTKEVEVFLPGEHLDYGKQSFISSLAAWASKEELRARTYCDIIQLSAEDYDNFKYPRVDRISSGTQTADCGPRGFEKAKYPEGCAPIATCSEVTLSPKQDKSKTRDPDADSWVYPPPNPEDWTTGDHIIWCIGSSIAHVLVFDGYFMPDGIVVTCWDGLVVMVTVVIAFMYPFTAAFLGDIDISFRDDIFITMCVFDVVIVMDFLFQFRINHKTPNGFSQGLKSTLVHYVKTPACLLDVIAMVMLYPVSFVFTTGFAVNSGLIYLLSLNRLIKLWKVHHYFNKKEQDHEASLTLVRSAKSILYVALLAHWGACLQYFGHPTHGFDNLADKESILMQYLVALYQAVSTMTGTQTYGDTTAHSLCENILVIFVRIGGFLLFGYILSDAISVLANKNKNRQIRPIQDFQCPFDDTPAADCEANTASSSADEDKQCHQMSEKVKIIFCLSMFFSALTAVWLFQACPIQGLTESGDYCHNNSWAVRLNGNFANLTNTQKFISSFYQAASTGAMAWNGYASTDNVAEMVTAISAMLSGMFTVIYVIATVTASKTVSSFKLACQRANFCSATTYLKNHNVDGHLRDTILRYFQYPDKCTMTAESDSPSCSTPAAPVPSKTSVSSAAQTLPSHTVHIDQANNGDVIIQMELEEEQLRSSHMTSLLHCLQAANRMVIDPRSVHWRIFSCIICVLTIIQVIIVTLQACYQYECLWLLIVSYACEIVFVIEIVFKFRLSQVNKYGDLEMDLGKVKNHYLKSLQGFALDLIATIPFEVFALVVQVPEGYRFTLYAYLRLTRLVRLPKVQKFFSCLEKHLDINLVTVCMAKVFVYIMLIIHFFACTWHIIIAGPSEYSSNDSKSLLQRYTDSVYTSVSLLTATGDQARTDKEMLFASFSAIVGQLLVACIVLGNIISMLANRDAQRVQYEKDRKHFKEHMANDEVDDKIRHNVIDYLDWQYNRSAEQLRQFQILPEDMRKELTMHMFGEYLKKVPLFAGCTKEFLEDISLHLKEVVQREGDTIVRRGDMGQEMHIIYRGQAEVMSKEHPHTTERVLNDGDSIDDHNILESIPSKNTAKALTQVNIITLSLSDLQETMAKYRLNAMLIKQNSRDLTETAKLNTSAAATAETAATSSSN